ncbi:FYN-binding protein 1 isoform X2 [Gouania willdenowi]|uniref:FYN-binding protein 1 isoform X2 n=1 Tax=Gouania willdenowi TaxID=441366 RepID=UPI0010542B2D|nr:FYN-binding protein 1-like isoform X2 [Gouania willdenowi]
MEEQIDVKALREKFNNRLGSHDRSSPKSSSALPFPAPGLVRIADQPRHAPSLLPLSPSGREASAQPGEINKVRQTGEMLQNMMLRQQKPRGTKPGSSLGLVPSPIRTPPAIRHTRPAQVTPLRRPLPPEGPLPLKPRRPTKVNLEPFLRFKQGPVLPAPRKRDRSQSSTNSLVTSGIKSPPSPPRFNKPKPLPQQITVNEVEDEQDPYDDIGNLDENSSHYVIEDDEDIYEFIDEERLDGSSDGIEETDNKELKMQQENIKRTEDFLKLNELKKKFQLQGDIEVLHTVRVRHDWYGTGKLDLKVRQGESLEILRVKDNQEGKWLARSFSGNYGYISNTCVDIDYEAIKRDLQRSRRIDKYTLPPPPPDPPQLSSMESNFLPDDDDDYDDVQPITDDFPAPPPEICIDPKSEKELKKNFKYEGPIKVLETAMVNPNGIIKKMGGKDLHVAQGDVVDVIQLTNDKKALCRNNVGKFGYVLRSLLIPIEEDIYDDVDYPVGD